LTSRDAHFLELSFAKGTTIEHPHCQFLSGSFVFGFHRYLKAFGEVDDSLDVKPWHGSFLRSFLRPDCRSVRVA
jgi:hypothetical protein